VPGAQRGIRRSAAEGAVGLGFRANQSFLSVRRLRKTRRVRLRNRLKPSQQNAYAMSDSRTSITARRASMRAGIAESTPIAAMTPRHVPASDRAEGVVARDP
jgi:hypothetical protein